MQVEKGPTPGSGGGAAPQHPNPQPASPARAPTATTAGDLQRHADVIMTLYSSGHLLVLKDANRIVRNMSVNGTRTMIQQFEVRQGVCEPPAADVFAGPTALVAHGRAQRFCSWQRMCWAAALLLSPRTQTAGRVCSTSPRHPAGDSGA